MSPKSILTKFAATTKAKGGDRPRHPTCAGNPPASQHVPRGGPLYSDGAAQGAAGPLAEPDDDGGDAGESRRGTSA
jgi:hypothetical protein